eukprot:5771528-Pyramimonas_sp.AAC.2
MSDQVRIQPVDESVGVGARGHAQLRQNADDVVTRLVRECPIAELQEPIPEVSCRLHVLGLRRNLLPLARPRVATKRLPRVRVGCACSR